MNSAVMIGSFYRGIFLFDVQIAILSFSSKETKEYRELLRVSFVVLFTILLPIIR